MTPLRRALEDYLRIRRRLGFELKAVQRHLNDFVDFLERAGAQRLTIELAVMWARLPVDAHPHWCKRRLGFARGFARYLATIDPSTEVPPTDLLPARRPRIAPYIYSPAEIAALMRATETLTPAFHAATFKTLIALIATTGLRAGEALALDRHDVDLHDGALHVRARKHKQREVPLHQTTMVALREYTRLRDQRWPDPVTPAFFLGKRGGRLASIMFYRTFPELTRQAGLEGKGMRLRPRAHDLRHTFAVRTLLDWYRAGENVDRRMPELSMFLGHSDPASTYWYLEAVPELMAVHLGAAGAAAGGDVVSLLAPTLQAFFAVPLAQLNPSPHTIGSYRDTFRLLLAFASEQVGKQPCELDIDDLDAPLIGAFLNHLEQDPGNSPRTRNNRLAAIHSLYRHAAFMHPEHLQTIGRVMAIPAKRYQRNNVNYLDRHEIGALLAAPDRNSWHGRRDHALLLVAIQTGLRVAELIGLCIRDVSLATAAHVLARGKGRKQRAVTLRPETVAVLRQWLTERHGQPDDPLFPTRQGQPLSTDTVEQLVAKHAAAAARTCDSLNNKHVTPHALRHTNAMLLRAGGADLATIALWLGHESTKTTSIYEHADPALKEQAIARTAPIGTKPGRYRPNDTLLAFLDSL